MIPPNPTSDEERRLEALRQYDLLDTEPEPVLDDLTVLAAHICEVPIALISVIDEKRQWFKSRVGLSVSETPRDISFCAHTILQRDLVLVPDATHDARFAGNPLVTGELHVRFYAAVPLVNSGGYALGTLCVIDREPRQLSPVQEEALRVLGRQAMAQLELRRRARELAESERLLRAIFDSEPECLKVLGPDGSLRMMNRAGLAMIEAESFGQVDGHCLYPLVAPEHRAAFETLAARVFRGESGAVEFQIVGLKGAARWLETHAAPLRDERGEVTALLGITRDITERKRAESALRESEEKFAKVFRNSPAAILLTTLDGLILDANAGFTRLTGYSLEEARNRTTVELGFWADLADRQRFITGVREHGRAAEFESHFRNRSGDLRTCLVDGELMELGGQSVIVGTVRDVTEGKQAEEKILAQIDELRRWQEVTLGREDRVLELKREVNELCQRLGEAARYGSPTPP